MSCVCTSPWSSRSSCDKCKGNNHIRTYHSLRFDLLCRLYGEKSSIGSFTREQLDSVQPLMDQVVVYGDQCHRDMLTYEARYQELRKKFRLMCRVCQYCYEGLAENAVTECPNDGTKLCSPELITGSVTVYDTMPAK